jgi:hypothetical protein
MYRCASHCLAGTENRLPFYLVVPSVATSALLIIPGGRSVDSIRIRGN